MYDFYDFDIDCEISGCSEYNKELNNYIVRLNFRETVSFAELTKQDLIYLIKQIEEAEDR